MSRKNKKKQMNMALYHISQNANNSQKDVINLFNPYLDYFRNDLSLEELRQVEKNKSKTSQFISDFCDLMTRIEIHNEKNQSKNILNLLLKWYPDKEFYHLLCKEIYRYEIMHDICVYSVSAPIHKLAYMILNERQNNYDEYKRFNKELLTELSRQKKLNYENIVNDFGITKDIKLNNIVGYLEVVKRENFTEFTLDNKTIYGLLKCKKQPLAPSSIKQKKGNQTTLFIGDYNGQTVIFEEKLARKHAFNKNNGTNTFLEENLSYQFGFYVKGNPKHYISLFRADYQPNRMHFNKLSKQFNTNIKVLNEEKFDVNSNDFDEFDTTPILDTKTPCYYDSCKNSKFAYSHIHINSERYSILLPKYNQGIDCINISKNKIYNYDLSFCKEYFKNNSLISQEDIEDYCNKFSIEQLDSFNKFVVFLRAIANVNVKENDILATSTEPFVKIKENTMYNLDIDDKNFNLIACDIYPYRDYKKEDKTLESNNSLLV